MRELHFAANASELTMNDFQWTVVINMAREISMLHDFYAALFRALYWKATTHRSVAIGHIFMAGDVIFAVYTAEWPLWALIILVDLYNGTLNYLRDRFNNGYY